jgi:hypothetical protein
LIFAFRKPNLFLDNILDTTSNLEISPFGISKEFTIYTNYNAIKCICAWDIVAVIDSLIAGI